MKFPFIYIEKIIWNPVYNYFFVISTNEGMKKYKLKFKYRIIKKELIENEKHFLEVLQNNNINIDYAHLSINECFKLYGSPV